MSGVETAITRGFRDLLLSRGEPVEGRTIRALALRTAIGIFSYDGGLHFGLTDDYDTEPDLDVLARGIEAGVAELVALAKEYSA